MIDIDNKFNTGDFVRIKHSTDDPKMIIALEVYLDGSYLYKVSGQGNSEYCQEKELTKNLKRDVGF